MADHPQFSPQASDTSHDQGKAADYLVPLIEALQSQEEALTTLTDLTEKQNEVIGGVVLVIQTLIDMLLDDGARAELELRLRRAPDRTGRQAARSIVGGANTRRD